MARKVKCQDTQEFSTSEVAYKADDGKYYSSEEAYLKIKCNMAYRFKCVEAMFSVMGYKEGMILPTIFYKKLSELKNVGFEAVYNTIKSQFDSIQWAVNNKQFSSETSKVMYIMAIINNHVMDEYKKLEKENKEREKLDKQSPSDYLICDDLIINNASSTKKDISKWLEDEDE